MTSARFNPILHNQSLVTFQAGATRQVAYSNTVATPLVGPALTLGKSAGQSCVSLGETVVYYLSLGNCGNMEAEAVLYDALPEGTAFVPNSVIRNGVPLPGANPAAGVPLGTIGIHAEICVAFQVIVVTIPPNLMLANEARAEFIFRTQEGRTVRGEVKSNLIAIQVRAVQVAVGLQVNTGQTFVGDTVTYNLNVVNEGSQPIQHIIVTFPVPAGGSFIPGSVMAGDVYTPSANPNEGIAVDPIAPGGSITLSFRVQVTSMPASALLSGEAYVQYSADETTYNTTTNRVTVAVIQPAVALSKSVNYALATQGDVLRYELVAENGSGVAVDAVLTDVMPKGTLFVWDSVTVDGVRIKGAQPADGIRLGTIKANSSAIVAIEANVPAFAASSDSALPTLSNQGKLQYTFRLADGRLVQQSAVSNTVSTRLVIPVIVCHVEAEPRIVEPGDMLSFEAAVSNTGNHNAEVRLARLVPSSASLLPDSIRINGISASPLWDDSAVKVGIVFPHDTVRIRYSAIVHNDVGAELIKGFLTAHYKYDIEGRRYTAEANSNVYSIKVQLHEE